MYVACQNGHEAIAALLLACRANSNAQTTDMATPLFIAAQMGHTGIVETLMGAGSNTELARSKLELAKQGAPVTFHSDIELANATNATPLFIACQQPGLEWCFKLMEDP